MGEAMLVQAVQGVQEMGVIERQGRVLLRRDQLGRGSAIRKN